MCSDGGGGAELHIMLYVSSIASHFSSAEQQQTTWAPVTFPTYAAVINTHSGKRQDTEESDQDKTCILKEQKKTLLEFVFMQYNLSFSLSDIL